MSVSTVPDWVLRFRDLIPTPCYVYSEAVLDESLGTLRSVLPSGASPLYSLKANPQPRIARFFNDRGVRPEVASEGEFDLCLAGGISPRDVLVGGVAKSAEFLARLCRLGCLAATVDSAAELARLVAVPRAEGRIRFLLRVNPGIAIGGLDMGGESQFGIGVDEAIDIVRRGEHSGHEFAGLHFYFGSQRLKPDPIVKTVSIVTDVLRKFRAAGCVIPRVDLGLGCGVAYVEKDVELDMAELKAQLAPLWADPAWQDVELWSEAGRSLVGRSGFFVTRVLERKQLNGRTYVMLDGGLNVHNPGVGLGRIFKSNPRFLFAPRSPDPSTDKAEICGSLCTSADRLGSQVQSPRLEAGDLVVIPNSGAYCHTTAMWGFNSQRVFSEALLSAGGQLEVIEPQHRAFMRVQTP
ncbi:MAG: hypothetical protein R3E75_12045 [Steroidobacteraceae bacterium]|nr:hypothetical protein [Nevskiaceae bacterium]